MVKQITNEEVIVNLETKKIVTEALCGNEKTGTYHTGTIVGVHDHSQLLLGLKSHQAPIKIMTRDKAIELGFQKLS